MGGKSGSKIVGYQYAMGLHFSLCHGPVDTIEQILVGDRVAYDTQITGSTTFTIRKPNLFGGNDKEGGIVGEMDVMMGESTQAANAYLQSVQGMNQPGYRGLVTAVYKQGLVSSNNPYIKPWAFTVSRALEGWENGKIFYGNKVRISTYDETFIDRQNASGGITIGHINTYTSKFIADAGGPKPLTDFIKLVVPEQAQSNPPYDTAIHDREVWFYLDNELLWHTGRYSSAERKEKLVRIGGGYNQENINFVAKTYCEELPELFQLLLELYNTDIKDISGGEVCPYYSMNPAHIVYECITNTDWGMGYPASFIDEDNFKSAADTFYDEKFGLCGLWNKQEPIREFIDRVMTHCGALLQIDRRTGKFKLKVIRDDYTVSDLPVLGEDEIVSINSYERPGYGDLINEINVVYNDICTTKEGGVTLQNLASIQAQGGIVSETKKYPMLPTFDLALRVAQRDLLSASTPLAKLKITCNRAAWDIEPGDVVKITWPKLGIASLVCRVLQADYGQIGSKQIKLDLVEDIFGLPASSFIEQQSSGWEAPDNTAKEIVYDDILETPYYLIARNFSTADFNAIKDDNDVGFISTVAARPSDLSQGYKLHTRIADTDNEFIQRPGTFDFAPTAVLTADIGKQSDHIAVDSFVGLDDPESVVGNLMIIGSGRSAEICEVVDAIGYETEGYVYQVNRGVLDTTPQEFELNDRVWFVTAQTMGFDATEYVDAEDVEAKVQSVTASDVFDIDSITAMPMTMDSRFGRPYPPGKFRLNGEEYPDSIQFPLTVSWAHRDREQQTAGIITQDQESIGPETGTTYNVRLYAGGQLSEEVTGITGTSVEFELNTELEGQAIEVRLESERDNLVSWQDHRHLIEGGIIAPQATFTIQASKVDADLTDFPVYLDLSRIVNAAFWDTITSSGGDIRCYKADGTTELPREVVSVDAVNKTGEVHCKYSGTLSSTTDTPIIVVVDGVSADYAAADTYGRNAVWSNYGLVYHLADSETTIVDSTSNARDGTITGTYALNQPAPVGDGIDFIDAGITASSTPLPGGETAFTITWWMRDDGASSSYIVARSNQDDIIYNFTASKIELFGGNFSRSGSAMTLPSDGSPHKCTYSYDGSTLRGFIDGIELVTHSQIASLSTSPLYIVGRSSGAINPFKGGIDEHRAGAFSITAAWEKTEYNNQSDPATFYTVT